MQSALLLLQVADKTVALVKSDRDDRYSSSEITTHDGVARPCYAVAQLADLKSAIGQSYDSIQVIAIDEAQFFPDLLEFCTEASDHDNKHLVVAGLDGDFQRQRFGQVSFADGYKFWHRMTAGLYHQHSGIACLGSPTASKAALANASRYLPYTLYHYIRLVTLNRLFSHRVQRNVLLSFRCLTLYLFQTVLPS